MIDLSGIEAVYIKPGATDMRKGITGLVGLAQSILPEGDMGRKLFAFCGAGGRNVKIIETSYDGWWLYQKRLVAGRLKWPESREEAMEMDRFAFMKLLGELPGEGRETLAKPLRKNIEKCR